MHTKRNREEGKINRGMNTPGKVANAITHYVRIKAAVEGVGAVFVY